jgi:hypothetical protein
MIMKKKMVFGILAAGIIVAMIFNLRLNTQKIISFASLSNIEALSVEDDDFLDEEDELELFGRLSTIPLRSSSTPFRAVKSSPYIVVYYLADLNNIIVRVVSSSGQTVYLNNVNPIAGGQLIINLAGAPSGEYTITFSSAAGGGTVYGTFNI